MARNHTVELLSIAVQMGWYGGRCLPVLLEAPPGCGKTQVVKVLEKKLQEVVAERGLSDLFVAHCEVLPQTMPESIEGIPVPDPVNLSLQRLPLAGIRKLVNAKYGIWFGDEYTSCSPQTGASAMTLIQDGRAGDTELPHTVARVLACNPPSCAAAGRDLAPPEINRVMKLRWRLPLTDLLDYFRGGPGLGAHVRVLPADWEAKHKARAAAYVCQFLSTNQKLANQLEHGAEGLNPSEPWASERQWENVIRVLAAVMSIGEGPNSDMAYMAVEGLVGKGVADQFIGFIREMDIPDPEVLLAEALKENGDPFKLIPETVQIRPDKMRLCLDSVATAACTPQDAPEDEAARWMAAWKMIAPWLEKRADDAISAARILSHRHPPGGCQIPEAARKVFAWRRKLRDQRKSD